jgi:hypothetical protein
VGGVSGRWLWSQSHLAPVVATGDGLSLRHRRKYDARKALEAYSARLGDETDLDRLGEELVGVVRSMIKR